MGNIAVILSGCGFQDGSEIHEATLSLLAIAEAGHSYRCFAPDKVQRKVVDHFTGKEVKEERNALHEAARIARGKIRPLTQLKVDHFSSLMIPGGAGAILTLSDFAINKENFEVDPDLKRIVVEFYEDKKPIGATCISPVVLAKIFQGMESLTMTLGTDKAWKETLEKWGMKGEPATISEMVSDERHKIYTTPCYMEPEDIKGLYQGIKKVVAKLQ